MSDEKDRNIDQRLAAFTIPDEVRVTLKRPIKVGDTSLAELSFRPPTVGEMKQIEKRGKDQGEAAAGIFMLSLLSNDKLALPDVESLNFIDMQIALEQLAPFVQLKPPAEAQKD